jgi:hypothetical protein
LATSLGGGPAGFVLQAVASITVTVVRTTRVNRRGTGIG